MTRRFRIAAYNIEWFANLFDEDDRLLLDDGWSGRWNISRGRQAEAAAIAMRAVDADAFLIVEAPDSGPRHDGEAALERFAAAFDLRQSTALIGFANGTRQELALLYDAARLTARHDPQGLPFTPSVGIAPAALGPERAAPRFDSTLPLDFDDDGAVDLHVFSKPPLEVEATVDGRSLRLIGVHAKSKAPHGATSEADAERLHILNRRKQLAQCEWIRRRVDQHLDRAENVIVLGDFNDGPGVDRYERLFGRSGVEVAMGDVSSPDRLLRNPFVKARLRAGLGWRPASARFFNREKGAYLNALLDFVMVSPALAEETAASWRIWHPFDDPACYDDPVLRQALLDASDHFPVSVDLML